MDRSRALLLLLLFAGCAPPANKNVASATAPPRDDSAARAFRAAPPAASPPARASRRSGVASAPVSSAPQATAPAGSMPAAERTLDVPGFEPALLFVPAGSEARPLLVAAHGAGGSPEEQCRYWRELTRDQAFVLCLRGTAVGHDHGFYFRDHRALERELSAAEAVTRAAEPRILAGSSVYAGFSQGATMGTVMISEFGTHFRFLALIESFQPWNLQAARMLAQSDGARVLLACGSGACAKVAQSSAHWLAAAGVAVRFVYARGAGHTASGSVMSHVAGELPWLLAGDPDWARLLAP